MNLLLQRFGLLHWFKNKKQFPIEYFFDYKNNKKNEEKKESEEIKKVINLLNDELESGWVHWCDTDRTLCMIEKLLYQIICLIFMVYAQTFTLTYLESSKLKDAFLESLALYARLHASTCIYFAKCPYLMFI